MSRLKQIPLRAFHEAQDARFVPFVGWEMPLQYTSILEEHRTVREAVGLFDVSHMGEVRITGVEATPFLDHLVTNEVSAMHDGQALYTPMCYEHGGVVDDLILYRFDSQTYLLCINAGNISSDVAWMEKHATAFNCTVQNVSDDYVQLALQGPLVLKTLSALSNTKVASLERFTFIESEIAGVSALISRTGYTGEDGVEIYYPPTVAETVAQALLEAGMPYGIRLCGLGARDSLRLEAGYPLYGHEISESISPLQAGLGWTVKLAKPVDFIGRSALESEKNRGVQRNILHFRLEGRRIARQGTPVYRGEQPVGEVVSGTLSPIINRPIGTALVEKEGRGFNTLYVNLRGHRLQLELKKPPLHKD